MFFVVFFSFLKLFLFQRYGYFSSKHANGVAINATYENISSTTTASILTQSMTNISEITTETPVEETTGVPHDESSEYESDHEYRYEFLLV